MYAIYKKDGIEYTVNGTPASSTPILTSTHDDPVFHTIKIEENGKGVNFKVWFTNSGVAYIAGSECYVDGTQVTFDYAVHNPEIYMTRNDPAIGGFREGWFNIAYKDVANGKHRISGNFRVKINQ